ncbi:hypothetical protein CH333_09785 [candidate division WOR-3 bacterium JGI_Cruoil_03_44_89]|uniref:HEAT repeat domain-containing protein n=1 Tax=candidate division WOR-3 bacterium JGI_Cruoil_03_44_89 TaxID=1973748 RepID=A0A235BNA8_UNCW3|nr:MAG: hypothetical protein CH333_09785 [candidate division WOR-3 bacterium JGI_Cruoil_03_44_89]
MHKKVLASLLVVGIFGSLFVLLITPKGFAMARESSVRGDNAKSAEVSKTPTADDTDSARMEKVKKEMVEEYRKMYLPKVPEHIKFLEQNYKNSRSLELCLLDLERALDLRALPVLIKVLSYNPRGINRAGAASTMGIIEKYNEDDGAVSALVEALDDTITDVQFNAAKALVVLGDTSHPIVVLTKLAKGKDKENWTVDWAGYMGLENATEEEIEEQKKRFKDGLQYEAIELLGELSTAEAVSVLTDIVMYGEDEEVKGRAREALNKLTPKN